jgi:hypothetical protein
MTDVFLERRFDPPLTPTDVLAMAGESGGCFDLYRVDWQQSFLSADGRQMICWFSGPDAESARIALREANADISVLWPGTVHDAPEPPAAEPNVVVERSWEEPVALDDIQAIEDAGAWCLETHRVKFARTFFSTDRKRMICLYHAPDAESVRLAQRQAQMPVDVVWAFQPVRPD